MIRGNLSAEAQSCSLRRASRTLAAPPAPAPAKRFHASLRLRNRNIGSGPQGKQMLDFHIHQLKSHLTRKKSESSQLQTAPYRAGGRLGTLFGAWTCHRSLEKLAHRQPRSTPLNG
ncbi:uncharacterized protein LOC121831475 isoform X2 [Peromyscus maniculatus bairdii]